MVVLLASFATLSHLRKDYGVFDKAYNRIFALDEKARLPYTLLNPDRISDEYLLDMLQKE